MNINKIEWGFNARHHDYTQEKLTLLPAIDRLQIRSPSKEVKHQMWNSWQVEPGYRVKYPIYLTWEWINCAKIYELSPHRFRLTIPSMLDPFPMKTENPCLEMRRIFHSGNWRKSARKFPILHEWEARLRIRLTHKMIEIIMKKNGIIIFMRRIVSGEMTA